MARCAPCREDAHAGCLHSLESPCDCFVCIAGELGRRSFDDRPRGRQDRERWETIERDPEK